MADASVEAPEKRESAATLIPTTIAKALIKIQKTLEPMKKSAANDAFGSSYVPLEEVTKKAHELLSAEGIGVIQSPITDETGHAALETILFTGSGQSFSRTTKLAMNKVDPQAHGSAITYTRRYALMAILGLTGVGEDDDGNKATGVVVPVSQEQKDRIKSLAMTLKHPPKQIEQQLFSVKTYDHAALAITNLEKLVSMRVRDNESKANAAEAEAESAGTKIAVGTGEIEAPLGEVGPRSELGFKQRLKDLKLAGPTYEKKVIATATRAPFLSKVMEKPDRIEALDNFLKALESGVHRLEAEFYAPQTENVIVDEKVA
ncbi:ERF family protein [Microbacterium oleivorans]|uniref:ERF family protein n=1 Tax=Microbacterium oleivorans TaxID=273677 RepID=UPI0034021B83